MARRSLAGSSISKTHSQPSPGTPYERPRREADQPMTAPRLKPDNLPNWPRLLTLDLAAAFVGQSPNAFEADIPAIWPAAVPGLRRKVWDREELDAAIDRIQGLGAKSGGATKEQRREAYQRRQHRHQAA